MQQCFGFLAERCGRLPVVFSQSRQQYRQGLVKPDQGFIVPLLLDAQIARAEEVEPTINAFTFTHYDEARALAKRAEAKYAAGEATGALEGLPVGIKDESYIAGKPTSNGSLSTKSFMEIIQDLMPGGISQAQLLGGVAGDNDSGSAEEWPAESEVE